MTTIGELQLRTADGSALGIKDLLHALMGLIESDPDARAYLAEVIGPAAPPGPPGVAWLPRFALARENGTVYLKIIEWIEWPVAKGMPPVGTLGKNGISTAEDEAQHLVDQLVPELMATLIRDGLAEDGADAGRILEQHRDMIARAIAGRQQRAAE